MSCARPVKTGLASPRRPSLLHYDAPRRGLDATIFFLGKVQLGSIRCYGGSIRLNATNALRDRF